MGAVGIASPPPNAVIKVSEKSKSTSNSISAGALPQTALGELTVVPRPPTRGPTSKRREGAE